jgi:hypothetical protein
LCYLINTLLCRMYRREYQKFIRINNVEDQQRQKLLGLLARNRDTTFGRRYAFGTITGVADYQDRVPLTTYENYADDISNISKGEPVF